LKLVASPNAQIPPVVEPLQEGKKVLDYAHSRKETAEDVDGSFRMAAFSLGFFAAIVVGAVSFVMLINTKSADQILFLMVFSAMVMIALAYGAYRLGREPGFNGIGRGVAVGLVLSMMALLPLGTCFLKLGGNRLF
jgi:hypothetical protein